MRAMAPRLMLYFVLLGVFAAALGVALQVAWRRRWQAYDPGWLVALVRAQMPDDRPLLDAVHRCTRASVESRAYTRFVSGFRANQPGAAWQFDHNVTLESEDYGHLVLDVLKDGNVGGLEFVDRLLSRDA